MAVTTTDARTLRDQLRLNPAVGFVLLGLVLIGTVFFSMEQANQIQTIADRVIHLRSPTTQYGWRMMNGINRSLADLRGWVLLGDPQFKQERLNSWELDIEPAFQTMQALSKNWTDQRNLERLRVIEPLLNELKGYQARIEAIAQTPDNMPATKVMMQDISPLSFVVLTQLRQMVDMEMALKGDPQRRHLLGVMGEVEGSLGIAMETLDEFLLTGDKALQERAEMVFSDAIRQMEDLGRQTALFTPEQAKAYANIKESWELLKPLPGKVIAIRLGSGWNVASDWLSAQANPTAEKIRENLKVMIQGQYELLHVDEEKIIRHSHNTIIILFVLFVVGALISGLFGSRVKN